jgi:hypothetical protein
MLMVLIIRMWDINFLLIIVRCCKLEVKIAKPCKCEVLVLVSI